MELVYLWVEDYKNIHKQGFNFSPRFECTFHDEYDEDGKLKDNCQLEIIEKKEDEYIKDFFGENINVTAIVGKNGSGKSSVLEVVRLIAMSEINNSFILFTLNKQKKIYISTSKKTLYQGDFICEVLNLSQEILISFFNYTDKLPFRENKEFPLYELNLGGSIARIEKNIISNYYSLSNSKVAENLNSFFQPYKFSLYMYLQDYRDYAEYNHSKFTSKKFTDKNNFEEFILLIYDYLILLHDMDESEIFFKKEDIYNIFLKNEINEIEFYDYQRNTKIMEFKIKGLSKNELDSIINIFFNFKIIGLNSFQLRLSDNRNRIINDLSFGERQILDILNQLYKGTVSLLPNKIVLLDEIDIGFHPAWQKKYFNLLIESLSKYNKKIHIILTSHSPFFLSDIPKQNIIFIDKYKEDDEEVKMQTQKEGNCKIVDGLKEKKQTFGANIHTLLSDSFFMEKGLMGEFAKGKIQEIIDFFNNKNSIYSNDKKKLKKVIESIGEPFLKDKLLKMYDEKYPPSDEERIKALEEQIASIKNGQN